MPIAMRRYLDRALADHRQALSNGEGISEQLWLSAILLSHVHWLLAHQKQPGELYELPLQVFKMLEGTSTLFVREKALLERLGYDWVGNGAIPHTLRDDELTVAARAQLQGIDKDLTHLLEAFNVPTVLEYARSIYTEAKDYILYYYRAFYSGAPAKSLRRFIGFMPLNCQPGYRRLLGRHDPLAMALMARMLVLLSALDHAWWMNGEGDYEVVERDVQGILDLMPVELRWVMDWPCKALDGEIVLKKA
ncbi:hypothetical protein LTR37_007191 [Vermiconidia calcicola]|uniref:Uncharacterized protein n=1 Tax=Vermiconidia calcicola TaxID=1690605 RepID=A0ACC3NET6_9PEZI|nr:hypothetical protein LTR37_007191 [Vermiconidia calcicola]